MRSFSPVGWAALFVLCACTEQPPLKPVPSPAIVASAYSPASASSVVSSAPRPQASSTSPGQVQAASATASAAAPAPNPAIARAEQRVEQTPEVRKLKALGSLNLTVSGTATCDRPDCDLRVEVTLDGDPYYAFVVRSDGTLLVQQEGGSPVSYDVWAVKERQALADVEGIVRRAEKRIGSLPEVLSYGKRSSSQGGHLVLWLEGIPPRGCTARDRGCAFSFYVGESFSTHATRWATFYVSRHGEALQVATISDPEPIPYAQWRTRKNTP